jgi:hypothetical protein
VLVAGALLAAACEPKHAPEPEAGPVAAPSAAPSVSASAAPSETTAASAHAAAQADRWDKAREAAMRIPCRAIAVDGHARPDPDAGPLASQSEVPDGWIAIAADSRMVAKDPRTTRETTFIGPARVRACVDHREESWVGSGRFESSVGAGETPGAEEWVVTPFGVVRYMAAKLAVEVGTDASVQVGSGAAFLWLPDDVEVKGPDAGPPADDDGWGRMAEGSLKLTKRGPADAIVRARTAVERCETLTRRSKDLAAELYAGTVGREPAQDAGSSPGSEAKEQVRTRRLARAACDVADLRVDLLPRSAPRSEMGARLEDAGVRPASAHMGAPGVVLPEAGP